MNESNVIKIRNPFNGDSMDLKIFTGSKANTSFRKHLVIKKYEKPHLSKKKKKNQTEATKAANNYQRNICVSLLGKSRRSYYENLNVQLVKNNKTFWKKKLSLCGIIFSIIQRCI